ncbi:chromate transporter [Klebsiella pneumoniae]|uniref:chromate transporter n=1 Tax=Klebsiella pneumoniae TaxID=573 RepID=UPI000F146D89|nr:chromate transporter [Klebsiella pneumoniae]VDA76064.1 hypothetical protein BANRA_05562 [Klebsiella pneumoniae]
MAIATCVVLLVPSAWGQVGVIAIAGIAGRLLFKPAKVVEHDPYLSRSVTAGVLWLSLFFVLLIGLPVLAELMPSQTMAMVDSFYRVGSLVFGGGHVVLHYCKPKWCPPAGSTMNPFSRVRAARAVPGPLFTFAAFLGASMNTAPSGWIGGIVCLLAIFAPSFLLVVGSMPFWERLRRNTGIQAALAGINAAVVGLLLAALYQPVWTSAIFQPQDFGLALVALVALMFWKLPPWLVVLGSGAAGWLLSVAL